MNVGSLFSGIGLLDYGLHLAGYHHTWLCEKDEFRRSILERRFPGVPVYPDVRAVDAGTPRVDVIAGGFPCKGVSAAGRREGFGHPETALWREMARVVGDLRPRFVIVENVAALLRLHDGECFGEVIGTLAALGYDTEWDCFPAAAFGAPHGRDRVFLTAVADAEREPRELQRGAGAVGAAAEAQDGAARHGRGVVAAAPGCGEAVAPDAELVAGTEAGERDRGPGAGGEQAARGEARAAIARASGRARRTDAPSDADDLGQFSVQAGDGEDGGVGVEPGDDAAGRGVDVEWGKYGPAIRRWEIISGRSAPLPLVRRVDDGRTVRVERSRLSALGDGVLVQAGWFVGARLMQYQETAA